MGVMSLVFALFTIGYILGVWTACVVFRQPQRVYEEGGPWRAAEEVPAFALAMARPQVVELVRR
jgi:hypothetical protein